MNVVNGRTFRSGNSEAVQLPDGMGFGIDVDVVIERNGDVMTIRPLKALPEVDPAEEKRKWLEMLDQLRAIERPYKGVQEREPIEFPDRPGL